MFAGRGLRGDDPDGRAAAHAGPGGNSRGCRGRRHAHVDANPDAGYRRHRRGPHGGNPRRHAYADTSADGNANTGPNGYTHADGYPYANPYATADAYSHTNVYSYAAAHADTYSDA